MEDQNSGKISHPRTLHLHIGIPKTASSWLQNKVFPRLDHLHYLNCPQSNLFVAGNNPEKKTRMMGKIFKSSSQIWQGFGDTIFEDMLGDRSEWLAGGRDLLISEEAIGRQGSRPALLAAHFRELKLVADNWGFERLNIICLIRRQDNWLASHYAQMSDRITGAGQTDFNGLIREVSSARESRYQFGMLLDYSALYIDLAEVTGEENLMLLPYEALKKSPHIFLQSLLTKLDTPDDKIEEICNGTSATPANVRSNQGVWYLRPRRTRIAGLSLPGWLVGMRKKTIKITPDIKDIIHKTYSASNQKLASRTGLDLEQYGYF